MKIKCSVVCVLVWVSVLTTGQVTLDGDVTVVGMFQIFETGECGRRVVMESAMAAEAVKWHLQRLSGGDLPFQIGFEAYSTCRETNLAAETAISVAERVLQKDTNSKPIVGVIGPEYSSEAKVVSSILSSVRAEHNILQIGYSTTAENLADKNRFPNFVRVIPHDGVQIQMMIKTMQELEWNRIGIVYENDTYGIQAAENLRKLAEMSDICVAHSAAIDIRNGVDFNQIRNIINKILLGEQPAMTPLKGIVFFGSKSTGSALMLSFQRSEFSNTPVIMVSEGIQLLSSVFEDQGKPMSRVKGSYVTAPTYVEIEEFKSHWKTIFTDTTSFQREVQTNSWLQNVFEYLTSCTGNCNFSPISMAEVDTLFDRQPLYIQHALLAAQTIYVGVTEVLKTHCGSIRNCSAFWTNFRQNQMIDALKPDTVISLNSNPLSFRPEALKDVQFTFSPSGEIVTQNNRADYQLFNYREDQAKFSLIKVGDYKDGDLTIDFDSLRDYDADGSDVFWPQVRRAQCEIGSLCSECIPSDIPEAVIFEEGDAYLIGLAPVYDSAGVRDCSSMRLVNGYQIVESIRFAEKQFQEKKGIYSGTFNGMRIGLLILNTCNNVIVVQRKLLELHKYGVRLQNGTTVNLSGKILGFVGALGSSVSIAAAGVLTNLGLVQVSYASTNPSLGDRDIHPYFMRVVPSDDAQAVAMIGLIKRLGADYVQLIYSAGAYGEGGRDKIHETARKEDVCVVQSLKIEEGVNYFSYYEQLRKFPHAKIVIVFLRSHVVFPFMDVLTGQMTKGDFIFIGSEAFAKNQYVLDNDEKQATLGSYSLVLEMAANQELTTHIRNNIKDIPFSENPWSLSYLQLKQNCSFSFSFDKTRQKDCSDSEVKQLPTDLDFVPDTWTITAYNAAISLLTGASNFLKNTCGDGVSELCTDYISDPKGLVEEIKKVRLDLDGSGTPYNVFTSTGDGNIGYKIYNVKKDSQDPRKLRYTRVGQFPLQGTFTFEKSLTATPTGEDIVSVCPNEQACSSCKDAAPPGVTKESESQTPMIIVGVLLGVAVLVIIGLVIFIIIRARKSKDGDLYLTPSTVYDPYSRQERSGDSGIGPTMCGADEDEPKIVTTDQ